MKESELRKHATCSLCRKPIGATGIPLFWTVTIQRWGVNMPALRRQDGLAAMLGSSVLAGAMGADEDMASQLSIAELTVCESCGVDSICVAELSERGAQKEGGSDG